MLLQPVCLCLSVCLSVRTPACPLCVQPACAPPLLDPRSSILTTPHFLTSSLLASRSSRPPSPGPGQPGKAEDPPPPPLAGNPAARKVPLPKSPLLDTPPKSDKAAGPPHQCASSPTISPRESLSDGAGKPRRFSPSLSPSLPTNPNHGHLHHTRHLVVARTHHSYLTTYTRAGDDSHNTQTALHSQRYPSVLPVRTSHRQFSILTLRLNP